MSCDLGDDRGRDKEVTAALDGSAEYQGKEFLPDEMLILPSSQLLNGQIVTYILRENDNYLCRCNFLLFSHRDLCFNWNGLLL